MPLPVDKLHEGKPNTRVYPSHLERFSPVSGSGQPQSKPKLSS